MRTSAMSLRAAPEVDGLAGVRRATAEQVRAGPAAVAESDPGAHGLGVDPAHDASLVIWTAGLLTTKLVCSDDRLPETEDGS